MNPTTRRQFCLSSGLTTTAVAWQSDAIWLEAGAFADTGGWLIDQQSIDRLGSAYLLAHGCGRPVRDAVTTVHFPVAGSYYVYVRTRDWVGSWQGDRVPRELRASGSPGVFQLLVNERPVGKTFGADGAEWHWQSGGAVRVEAGPAKIALHDLTGFDGRCAAVCFSRTLNPTLPDGAEAVRTLRSRLLGQAPVSLDSFDLVVVGGGIAGICAAVAAARRGLKTALIHNRPVLGGNTSSEIRVSPGSVRSVEPYVGLGSIIEEFDWNRQVHPEETRRFQSGDDARAGVVRQEKNLTLLLNHHVFRVDNEGASVRAVHAQDIRTGAVTRLAARFFADCSGDANLGFLAGADFRMGREGRSETGESRAAEQEDKQLLGSTLHWYSRTAGEPVSFPELPWALPFDEERCQYATEGAWNWETGFHLDQASQTELIRDHKLRAIYGNWSFQKNHSAKKAWYSDRELAWVAHILGKRESRRLLGDLIYSQQDLDSGKMYPDGLVACNWGIDIHLPDPKNNRLFAGWAFRAVAEHFDKFKAPMRWLPYRCLYSRNVPNLFMAGRNVSCTHVAFAWFRNQRTTAMMGETVGLSASVCVERDTSPRGIHQDHLGALLSLAKQPAASRQPVRRA